MNKNIKKNLVEFSVFAGIIIILFVTGLHTEVFGFLQRGVLETGVLNPNVEEKVTSDNPDILPKADFGMELINSVGKKVNMEEFKGKVIFINLWATWCPPCIAEMPGINKLYNELQDEDIEFLMVSLDDDFEKAKRFKEKKGFNFEIYKVSKGIPSMYYSQSIPTTFIINSNGELALTHTGMADYDTAEFQEFLRSLK